MCSRIEGFNPDIGNNDDALELSPATITCNDDDALELSPGASVCSRIEGFNPDIGDTSETGNRTCSLEVASINSNDCLSRIDG